MNNLDHSNHLPISGKQTSDWLDVPMSCGAITRAWNSECRSASEFTPWLFGVTPAIVCNKDSGLLAVYEIEGLDVDSAPNAKLNDLAAKLEFALGGLMQAPVPVYLWFQARRLRSDAWPTAHFPDPVSARLDALRRASFETNPQYTNRHYLCVLMQPPQGLDNIAAKLAALMKHRDDGRNAVSRLFQSISDAVTGDSTREFKYSAVELAEAVAQFEKLLQGMQSAVQDITFTRLLGDELGGYLASTTEMGRQDAFLRSIAPAYRAGSDAREAIQNDQFAATGVPRFLDTRLPTAGVFTNYEGSDGSTLAFVNAAQTQARYVRVTSIVDYPPDDVSFPSQLDGLLYIDGEIVLTMVFQCLPRAAGMKLADNARRYHANRKFSLKQMLSAAANKGETAHLRQNTARSDAEEAAAEIENRMSMGRDLVGFLYMNVLAVGDTPAEALRVADSVQQTLSNARYACRVESIHALSAWSASLPGMHGGIVRWLPVAVANLADIAPVRTVAMGHYSSKWLTEQTGKLQPAACVMATDLGTPYWFDFFGAGAGHGMLVGPTGAGKSIMGGFLMTMLRRYEGAQVIVMDKDLSLRIPILLQGGSYADLSPENKRALSINPLALLHNSAAHLPWVSQWLELLLSQNGVALSMEDRLAMQAALQSLALPSKNSAQPAPVPTLSRLFAMLGSSALKDTLREWVRSENGTMAAYFDNETDAFDITGLQGFEMGSILQHASLAVPFTEYLFYRIEQHLKAMRDAGRSAPFMIYLSEVWHLLRHPTYQNKIVDWLKTLRKLGALVWMDTQSLEDLVSCKAFPSLRDNVLNKIFLPNFEAASNAAKRVYIGEFQLSEEQLQRVVSGTPKRNYFLRQGGVGRMLELALGQEELAILRSDNRAQAAMEQALSAREAGSVAWRDVYFENILQR